MDYFLSPKRCSHRPFLKSVLLYSMTVNSVNAAHFVFISLSVVPPIAAAQPDERRRSAANLLECSALCKGKTRSSQTNKRNCHAFSLWHYNQSTNTILETLLYDYPNQQVQMILHSCGTACIRLWYLLLLDKVESFHNKTQDLSSW